MTKEDEAERTDILKRCGAKKSAGGMPRHSFFTLFICGLFIPGAGITRQWGYSGADGKETGKLPVKLPVGVQHTVESLHIEVVTPYIQVIHIAAGTVIGIYKGIHYAL